MIDLLREQDPDSKGTISTDALTSTLQSIAVPLESDEFSKLLALYDKKGEGVMNYDDFLSEQKYIHAVSRMAAVRICMVCCSASKGAKMLRFHPAVINHVPFNHSPVPIPRILGM